MSVIDHSVATRIRAAARECEARGICVEPRAVEGSYGVAWNERRQRFVDGSSVCALGALLLVEVTEVRKQAKLAHRAVKRCGCRDVELCASAAFARRLLGVDDDQIVAFTAGFDGLAEYLSEPEARRRACRAMYDLGCAIRAEVVGPEVRDDRP